jgi:hypothetical protein
MRICKKPESEQGETLNDIRAWFGARTLTRLFSRAMFGPEDLVPDAGLDGLMAADEDSEEFSEGEGAEADGLEDLEDLESGDDELGDDFQVEDGLSNGAFEDVDEG